MNVLVLVPWLLWGGQDGVPDDGFGGWVVGRAGGVDDLDVEEHLFRVPVVERGEICDVVVSCAVRPLPLGSSNVPVSRSNRTCAYSSFFVL